MSTIRIYKVAEVLGLPSQEVIDLLKRDHGIEVKSASSTIEEIVAKQFAERLSRERQIDLPRGNIFGGTSSARIAPKKGRTTKKTKSDPPKLVKPSLGPPRLIKSAKAERQAAVSAENELEPATITDETATISEIKPPDKVSEPPITEPPKATEEVASTAPSTAPEEETAAKEKLEKQPPLSEVKVSPDHKVTAEPVTPPAATIKPIAAQKTIPAAEDSELDDAAKTSKKRTGRFVPPTLRLRVEDSKKRQPAGKQDSTNRQSPAAVRSTPSQGPAASQPPLGGPRPLPSQPVRPTSARPLPARPAVGYRPPPRTYRSPGRRAVRRPKPVVPVAPKVLPPITRTITIAEGMAVKDLADRLEVRAKDVLKKLIEKRLMMTINTTLDPDTATMIAREFGADVKLQTFEEEMVQQEAEETKAEDLMPRAPVVTVMGHVDHGKTTLLDAIRSTRVAEGEAGGITQHIGAYAVEVKNRRIVFLDTPGHEAFTMMRSRGASVTDVIILVVAADDGVMPQTQEAIDHARAADVPILVAINKIDKADANPDRVKQELAERDLAPEDWGGQTVMVPVSAKNEENLESLLEMILLITEMGEHKANPKRIATGTVLEAKVDRGRGPVATILVQDGTLKVGDNFIAGTIVGRVRALIDDRGNQLKDVGPSSPVEVLGLTGVPKPGDAFQGVDDAAKSRQIALLRQNQAKEKALGDRGSRLTLESLQEQLSEGGAKELPIIIKADVQGSSEVLAQSLEKLGDERVKIRIIHSGVGAVNESDVLLASTSNAIIIAFNVRPDRNANVVAESEGVDIRKHSVIYHVTDEIKQAMAGLLEPTFKEKQLGLADIREVFKVPKFGSAAGCIVTEGRITRSGEAKARLVRDSVVIHEGKIGSLRRFKDDVTEVKSGVECGIAFERYSDIKVGDVIESFTVETIVATVQ